VVELPTGFCSYFVTGWLPPSRDRSKPCEYGTVSAIAHAQRFTREQAEEIAHELDVRWPMKVNKTLIVEVRS
jgi:hypothetical protein